MAKLTKNIFGVVAGDVYPTVIEAGEECPVELEDAARELDALEQAPAKDDKPGKGA